METAVPEFYLNTGIKYMSQFEASVELGLPEETESLLDPEGVAPVITFTKGRRLHLVVENNVTCIWTMLKFSVKNFDLTSSVRNLKKTGYLSLSLKFSLVKIPITLNSVGLKKHEVGKI